jgi:hypothetical protein
VTIAHIAGKAARRGKRAPRGWTIVNGIRRK